jgi:hypothetical protein
VEQQAWHEWRDAEFWMTALAVEVLLLEVLCARRQRYGSSLDWVAHELVRHAAAAMMVADEAWDGVAAVEDVIRRDDFYLHSHLYSYCIRTFVADTTTTV